MNEQVNTLNSDKGHLDAVKNHADKAKVETTVKVVEEKDQRHPSEQAKDPAPGVEHRPL